ncbi:RHS repeat-associated core domain-containing protein [Litoreibacter albidus]|uniref:RHS repeat-associated core domain-containing protein n=1 Tax=Litoreibacter albidus TaxID=670155 RepID=UPI00147AC7CF|nr:RHS repeat-associated core domain-containing protein [Litoreibacter albidus]
MRPVKYAPYALHPDRQGSVIAITEQATDTVMARYVYDAFGAREQTVALTLQDYGFTGREFDAETGLYYYRARHYDPAQGRFIQSDPLGFAAGDLNLYAYTWNDPANWSDPSGLSASGESGQLNAGVMAMAQRAVSKVGRGAVCVAGRISTALSELGAIVSEGQTFNNITSVVSLGEAACRTKIKAKKKNRNCGCPGGGKGGVSSGNSFPDGTEVLTPNGKVAIETLREGDLVLARNEDTGVSGVFPVTAVMSREAAGLMWITLENEAGKTSRLGVTSGHPMFVVEAGWTEAEALSVGDKIRSSDLSSLVVLAIELDDTQQKVHNLEIAEAHTYFAGELEAWGHNASWSKHRKSVYQDCGGKCSYCGIQTVFSGPRTGPRKDRFSLDHVIPRKWGGSDDKSNLIGCCVSCNSKRGAPKP